MTAAWVGLAPPKSSPSLLHLPSETAASGPKLGARFPSGFRLGLFREAPWQGAVGRRRERLSEISFPVPSCGIDTGRPCPATEGGLLSEFQQPMALAPQALGGKDPPPRPLFLSPGAARPLLLPLSSTFTSVNIPLLLLFPRITQSECAVPTHTLI